MQSAKDYLQASIDRKLSEANGRIAKADTENRSLSDEERSKVESTLSEVEGLRKQLQDMEDNERLKESIDNLRGSTVVGDQEDLSTEARTLGEAFTKSSGYRTLKERGFKGNWTTGPVELPFDAKATVTAAASPIAQPDVQPGVLPLLQRQIRVTDLIATAQTNASSIRYMQETTFTNAAAATAPGDLKPEGTLVYATVDEPVQKIAHFIPVHDEMLEDVPALRGWLDEHLATGVRLTEEAQILSGSGTAPNLRGILNRTGVQTEAKTAGAGDTIHDAVYRALNKIRINAFVEPNGIVMHPTNFQAVKLAKDGNGQYYGGGPFMGQYGVGGFAGDTLWGLPVAISPLITVNTALVGDFRQATLFRRSGLTVEASNSHSDYFQRNMTAIRAELREALAVRRPAAFATVTGLGA